MKIGVFDSGIGGQSVADAIRRAMPNAEVLFVNDVEHMPYGDKPPAIVLQLVIPILQNLVDDGCDVIVIACNTVTTHHIASLRNIIRVPLIGIEPMIKPAAKLTKSGVIAVCATPATLASDRYAWLKRTYGQGIEIIEPDCSRWSYMIEHNRTNELELDQLINDMCDQGADIIVLGCTHYHWIEDEIKYVAKGRAIIMQPEAAVVKQLQRVLAGL